MTFIPLQRLLERVEIDRSDSDVAFFSSLMYWGEFLTKVVTCGLIAGIEDDRERSRYEFLHKLARADGIGAWAEVIEEVLYGPAAQHLMPEARSEQRELTQRSGPQSWQHQAVSSLNDCLRIVDRGTEPVSGPQELRRWFRDFARLRNKTRGHGAPTGRTLARLCPKLESSLRSFTENHSIFRREWVYLHRNLSGKYRVTRLGESTVAFDRLKSSTTESLPNGVYIAFDRIARVELTDSDVDASDFLIANGSFTRNQFELLSYITGDTTFADSSPYLPPIGPLPQSETHGLSGFDPVGEVFANIPPPLADYIRRSGLEAELLEVLTDERHPVITLLGRGGIGKTSLALATLQELAKIDRFALIVWFSARDIDLLEEGPKRVTPAVSTARDLANLLVTLLEPSDRDSKDFKPLDFFANALTHGPIGPTLFVFDNFETMSSPADLYKWLDTRIRNPNKILVTTRQRDFKGDYPIEVRGMSELESNRLVDSVSTRLGVKSLISASYKHTLYQETDGHPYVLKIFLGEVAKAKKLRDIERVVADSEDILTALFERTYASLSPGAQRIFLMLASWRSVVPRIAIEAVVLRSATERIPVSECIDELERSSFIEITASEADGQLFVATPLVAALFGRRKLAASPLKSAVEADTEILQLFGASGAADVRHGVSPRIERLVKALATRINRGQGTVEDYAPMMEFISRHYAQGWLLLSNLQEESGSSEGLKRAKEAMTLYLETPEGRANQFGWRRLADLCRSTDDVLGELHALAELCDLEEVEFFRISNAAARFSEAMLDMTFDSDVKQILARRIASVMEHRIREANATDCSRLAWLFLHLRDEEKAAEYTHLGLDLDSENEHCRRLAIRLGLLASQ